MTRLEWSALGFFILGMIFLLFALVSGWVIHSKKLSMDDCDDAFIGWMSGLALFLFLTFMFLTTAWSTAGDAWFPSKPKEEVVKK